MNTSTYKLLHKNFSNPSASFILSIFNLSNFARSFSLPFSTTQEQFHRHSSLLQSPLFPNPKFADERLHHLLQSCKLSQTLDSIQPFHALSITIGPFCRQPIFFTNNLISIYSSIGYPETARKVFDEMPQRNTVSYNTLINVYGRGGRVEEAWELFNDLWACGFTPTQFTFVGLLSCDGLDLCRGQVLHSVIVKNGLFFSESYAGTALIGLLGSFGLVNDAIKVFADMPVKSLVCWNSVIVLLGNHGYVEDSVNLFVDLLRAGFSVAQSTLVGLLSNIGGTESLSLCEQLHTLMVKSGLDYEIMVLNSLLHMYVKSSGISLAEKLLKRVPFCDVVSYNTVISGMARGEKPERALELLLDMSHNGISPDEMTFLGLVNCLASFEKPNFGAYVHAKVIKSSMESDVYLGNALVNFYGKFDMLDAARSCFAEISDKNVVSWTTLIQSYSKKNHGTSISLLKEMFLLGLCPNEFTLSALLKTAIAVELLALHCLTLKLGHHNADYVLTSLVTAYARNKLIPDALVLARASETRGSTISSNVIAAVYNRAGQYDKSLETLSSVDEADLVSWNILISASSHDRRYSQVFELFKLMQLGNNTPDKYTIASVLCACTNLCSLFLGKSVHSFVIKTNLDHSDTFTSNLLIDMYGKCGNIGDSVKIFSEMQEKNLVTWTCLISALGSHGFAREALERFEEMKALGLKPDGVTFVSLLSACRHGKLVKEGLKLFAEMESVYGVKPEMDHYVGIVDLLSRSGLLKEAEAVISRMPFSPNAFVWQSFLEGSRRHKTSKVLMME